ncbi:MAG: alpha/beta hydrolase [Acidobacteria bacterium]|nr:alpha/beta hydrolase [Acidobacteriota bacterium]
MRAPLSLLPILALVSLTACAPAPAPAPKGETKAPEPAPQSAAATGQKFQHDGAELYYEIYGSGEPLLLIHGNGGSSRDLAAQIAYFRKSYQVIAMDSRDQGRSGDTSTKITYEKMTDDQAALLDHLKLGPVNVVGWSDGGIEALLLAIRHPAKVKKLVSMAANLTPQGLHPDALRFIKEMLKDPKVPARDRKVTEMMLSEPQIKLAELEKITVPALILASDHDMISDEHTVDIYHHIPNAQLQIFANATHMIPFDDPDRFNSVVANFLQKPFVKVDRLGDTMKSLEKLRAAATK